MEDLIKRLNVIGYQLTFATQRATVEEAAAALAKLQAERDEANALCERLRREAEQWAGEARAHKSSLHEAYQAITGATGEPGNWNGARPIREAVDALKADLKEAREALRPFRKAAASLLAYERVAVVEADHLRAASRALGGGE